MRGTDNPTTLTTTMLTTRYTYRLSAVERACRDVLDYASHLVGGGDRLSPSTSPPEGPFLVRDDPGRVLSVLNNGTGGRVDNNNCSFASLCRLAVGRGRASRAANAIAEDEGNDGALCQGEAAMPYCDLTEENVYLVVRTLVESGRACIIPAASRPCATSTSR